MPAGIPLDHFHRGGCDGKRLLHGISIDCNKKVSGFARGSSAVPLGEGKASSPSQSNPSDESARLAFYLETAPLLQKAPPLRGSWRTNVSLRGFSMLKANEKPIPQRRAFAESGAVMLFSSTTPSVKKQFRKIRRFS